jgi:acyl-coenzyme A synthetase/AMP-(fatty) acid ligase
MLLSGGCERNPALVAPLSGTSYRFVSTTPSSTQSQSAHRSTAELFELVILAESPDCPDVSLRHADGNFHTGDLFQEVLPGFYLFRGRDDDWIKSENSLRCDTKAIEDNARAMCGTLIAECVVVGTGRPSPVMFIEPGVEMNHDKLKKDIFRKIRLFHSRRYLHEQIISPDMIVVVPKSTLPRTATKGNIRRKAVEEAFKSQIDEIFARTR